MTLLLDTVTWLWLQTDPDRVPSPLLDRLASDAEDLVLSAVSTWEIAIKYGLGRLGLPDPPSRYVPARMADSGVRPLPVSVDHTLRVAALPAHHTDPFDRLLVAQAQLEGMTIVTPDAQIGRYDVETVWG